MITGQDFGGRTVREIVFLGYALPRNRLVCVNYCQYLLKPIDFPVYHLVCFLIGMVGVYNSQ